MPDRFSASSFIPKPESKLFFDTNIWLKLAGPSPVADKKSRVYGRLLKNASDKNVNAKIGISAPVISEFLNRFCRDDWSANYREAFLDYKDFRASREFEASSKTAALVVREILKYAEVLSFEDGTSDTSRSGIEYGLNQFLSGKIDFNDALIEETCRRHGYVLVTDDGDFAGVEIPVVSANSKLFFQNNLSASSPASQRREA